MNSSHLRAVARFGTRESEMPLGNTSENPSDQRQRSDSSAARFRRTAAAIPLGRIGSIRLDLSCSVVIAATIVVVVVASVAGRQGNSDLPLAALIGAGIWVGGWIAQTLATVVTAGRVGHPVRQITLNLLGPESSPRAWSARQCLAVSAASLSTLIVLGSFFWWGSGGFGIPTFSWRGGTLTSPPAIGTTSVESMWRVGAWLCWAQAVFQMFPLPRTTGRGVLAALAAICSPRLDIPGRVTVFRRCLMSIALLTSLAAVWLFGREQHASSLPSWTLAAVLAVWLWVSARRPDLQESMAAFESAPGRPGEPVADGSGGRRSSRGPRGWGRGSVLGALRAGRDRRRLRRAMGQERQEASDAERLDEILGRLHRDGPESLSGEDREILQRVSRTIKKLRQRETEQDG